MSDQYAPRSVLLIGAPACGKATIVGEAARQLQFDYLEVDMAEPKSRVRNVIAALIAPDRKQVRHQPEIGTTQSAGKLLLLRGLQSTVPDEDYAAWLYKLIRLRRIELVDNEEYPLALDTLVVGTCDLQREGHLHVDSTVRAAFYFQLEVRQVTEANNLRDLCTSIVHLQGGKGRLVAEDSRLASLLQYFEGNLNELTKFIQGILFKYGPMCDISNDIINEALLSDTVKLISRLVYCWKQMTEDHVHRWLNQFTPDTNRVILKLLRCINEKYFIRESDIFQLINTLLTNSRIEPRSRVAFCRWQFLGRGGPAIANRFKASGQWKVMGEISMLGNEPPSHSERLKSVQHLIMVDDFVGTGDTVCRILQQGHIETLLSLYPRSKLNLMVLLGYSIGLKRISDILDSFSGRVVLHVGQVLDERDQCFSAHSSILQLDSDRLVLAQICRELAATRYPELPETFFMGYKSTGSLCVFHDTVPNNTLPFIWYDKDPASWYPLFPASGTLPS